MTRIISKIPLLGSGWNRFRKQPWVSKSIDSLKLRLRYGNAIPDSVILPNSKSPIFLDKKELRGRAMLIAGANGQPGLKRVWHAALTTLEPGLVIDVGANYGEFVFGERYPFGKKVIAVEANPALRRWLDRSHKAHQDSDKIQMIYALASNTSDDTQTFYIDPTSSGRSSAVERDFKTSISEQLPTVAIDDLAADLPIEETTTVFKIDVEGYEPQVLSGMQRLLNVGKRVFGFIEFNEQLIRKTDTNPEEFLQSLPERFQLVALPKNRPPHVIENRTLAETRDIVGNANLELDIALISDPGMTEILNCFVASESEA